jgi:hypothetical protein
VRLIRDHNGLAIRFTDERHRHILEHPEMAGVDDEIEHALAAPDSVVESVSDPETRLYYRSLPTTLVGAKQLCVVVKVQSADAFVITAYLTDKVKKGRVLWPTAG